jgi:hypothetical protein
LSESQNNKSVAIKALKAQLNNVNFQLTKVKKKNINLADCVTNSTNLKADLSQAVGKIQALQVIKNKNEDIETNLNNQLSLLKANLLQQKETLETQNQTITEIETTNAELKELFILMRSTNSFNSALADEDLKELFILKDFEINEVNPSELTKQTNTYTTPEEIKENTTIYAVQFGAYMKIQPSSTLKGLNEVWYETTKHGTYVYLSGQFKSPQEATVHKNSLKTLGYLNAFVVTITK